MRKLMMAVMIVAMSLVSCPVMADNIFNPICEDASLTENQKIEAGCKIEGEKGMGRITNLINVAIGLAGIIAVVVIVFGGQRYITSAGEPGKAKQAKDMIMYGVVGLIVIVLAWAIVNFVISGVAGA